MDSESTSVISFHPVTSVETSPPNALGSCGQDLTMWMEEGHSSTHQGGKTQPHVNGIQWKQAVRMLEQASGPVPPLWVPSISRVDLFSRPTEDDILNVRQRTS